LADAIKMNIYIRCKGVWDVLFGIPSKAMQAALMLYQICFKSAAV